MSEGQWGLSSAVRSQGPTPPEMRVARLAAAQNAVVSRRQLLACGLTSSQITLRTRRGTLHRVYRGVYAVLRADALTVRGRLTAAVLACAPGAVLSDWAAGVWWALVEPDGRHPEVTVPGDRGRKVAGIRVHRRLGLDRRDVWMSEGILVSSPARTALDLAATMPSTALRRTLRQAQAEGRVSVRQLQDVVSRAHDHRGASRLRAVIADGPTPTRSAAEDLLLDLLDEAALPRPEVNARLRLDGTTVMPDLLWREQKLIVEVDGDRFHTSTYARDHDGRRQALLEAEGYRVLRVSYRQLVEEPDRTIARIAHALAFMPTPTCTRR